MSLRKLNRLVTQIPLRSITSTNQDLNRPQLEEKVNKSCVLKEAERIVGYPTSFLNLRWILNDEIANVAVHIRRLIGTNHPLLETAKNLLVRNELPSWGLVILLISKTAGFGTSIPELERDKTADTLHSQRILAEVCEMIKTSNVIHKGIINIDPELEHASDLIFGNKMALLSGDYLLSASFQEIARLKNSAVEETIWTTIRDLSESQFIGLRAQNNDPIPTRPLKTQKFIDIPTDLGPDPFRAKNVLGHMKSEWILRSILSGGSLLGRCCQASMILAKHGLNYQKASYEFGRNLALAWQAALERKTFENALKISLVSAPVMLHLAENPELYNEMETEAIDYDLIKKEVLRGQGLEKTALLEQEFGEKAVESLREFPESESKASLVNIVKSI